jgi:hypothetical protein
MGIVTDLPREKIKEIVRRYSWKESFNRLKVIAKKIRNAEEVSSEELDEIDLLFSEEPNNQRRQIFTNNQITIEGKLELLEELRANNIFILSHGAIEAYYPKGIDGDDKPTKALNAIKYLKQQDDCRSHLPNIIIDGKKKCELELTFEKIFA